MCGMIARHRLAASTHCPILWRALQKKRFAAALYLALDESAFVTGIELLVDGGYAQISARRCVAPSAYQNDSTDISCEI
jgi:hypothetical protein